MPKPPILPVLDWRTIFDQGHVWSEWIQIGESPENRERMKAAVERQELLPREERLLRSLSRTVHVVAFAEDWCGDVVRHVPVLERMARIGDRLRVRYLSHQEQPEAFCRFLTNGGEAVPKFVFLSEDFVETGSWGPMPETCREFIARGKACGDVPAAREKVARAYGEDKPRRLVVEELMRLVGIAGCERP